MQKLTHEKMASANTVGVTRTDLLVDKVWLLSSVVPSAAELSPLAVTGPAPFR
jgi:hypothetical protein